MRTSKFMLRTSPSNLACGCIGYNAPCVFTMHLNKTPPTLPLGSRPSVGGVGQQVWLQLTPLCAERSVRSVTVLLAGNTRTSLERRKEEVFVVLVVCVGGGRERERERTPNPTSPPPVFPRQALGARLRRGFIGIVHVLVENSDRKGFPLCS
jgi:hypothetical protein